MKMSQTGLKIACAIAAFAISAVAQQSNLLPDANISVPATRSQFQNERHLLDFPAGNLYYNSAFAHGYRHGYEEGFHVGDLDLQMGRQPRRLSKIAEYQHDCPGFKRNFGAKELFRKGYREGFRSGYQDATSDSEFRETEKVEAAAQGITLLLGSGQRAAFDQGFSGGYASVAAQQSTSKRVTLDYIEQYCQKTQAPGKTYGIEYCSGFSRGYLLGLADQRSKFRDRNGPPVFGKIIHHEGTENTEKAKAFQIARFNNFVSRTAFHTLVSRPKSPITF